MATTAGFKAPQPDGISIHALPPRISKRWGFWRTDLCGKVQQESSLKTHRPRTRRTKARGFRAPRFGNGGLRMDFVDGDFAALMLGKEVSRKKEASRAVDLHSGGRAPENGSRNRMKKISSQEEASQAAELESGERSKDVDSAAVTYRKEVSREKNASQAECLRSGEKARENATTKSKDDDSVRKEDSRRNRTCRPQGKPRENESRKSKANSVKKRDILAILACCDSGDIEKAFEAEKHMVESGVYPEESELRALLKVSVEAREADKVYSILQKLRVLVGRVTKATGEVIESWFSSTASRVGKRKWDLKAVREAAESMGGGWHGQGWLGHGKWTVQIAHVDEFGVCGCCREKLVTVDLDPVETEKLAGTVAAVAGNRDSSFQRFQKWLDYYGPFEAIIDAANVGLFSQKRFSLSKVNRVVNAVRQKLPSKTWPLVIVHNRRISEKEMDNPRTEKLMEKLKNANAIYTTPTGSNDDWYWLYAAIKSRGLIVTNDEMRDHTFQLLGNDVFPKWKASHQVHFSFNDGSPEILMPPSFSTVIQESEGGHWHVPVADEHESGGEMTWLCITRDGNTRGVERENDERDSQNVSRGKPPSLHGVLFEIETSEKLHGCVIDFQI